MELSEHFIASPSPYHHHSAFPSPLPPIIGHQYTPNPLGLTPSDSLSSSMSSAFSQMNLHNPIPHDPSFSPISDHWAPHKDPFFNHFAASPTPGSSSANRAHPPYVLNPIPHDPSFSPISDHWAPHKDPFFNHFAASPSPSIHSHHYESVSPFTNRAHPTFVLNPNPSEYEAGSSSANRAHPPYVLNPNSILNLKPVKNRARRTHSQENIAGSLNTSKLTDLRGRICQIAREQYGSQILQERVCKEKPDEVGFVVEEVVCYVLGDLMADAFGNYLMQKLFEVASTEQLTRLVWVLTRDPRSPIKASLNHFGTRSMEVLIEQLASRNMTSVALLLTSSLKNNVVKLSTDVNGYHVINACLRWLPYNLKRFILEKAALHCIDISRDKHGCRILQLCIKKAEGADKERIITSVCANGFFLSQDAYGNYVVQCILGLEEAPWVCTHLAYRLRGHYVRLAKHKCSSNVVEKCLEKCEPEVREGIIYELLEDNEFEQLLSHRYANYVIRTALKSSQGRVRSMLVDAIKPHMENMRTNPYSKRIYSTLLHIM